MPTCSFASAPVWLQEVTEGAVTAEASFLVVALLAAKARDETLVDVVAGLGVVEQLETRLTSALGPERSFNADVAAAAVVQYTVLFVFGK